ncbi:M15 family metallopeptidase [Succinivibrio sp.]|uniref:M15 family metallopeptidase n=1 Tax=Succinivibrio sp. TaxID=2053619 RepID=UPI0038636DC4
MVTKEEYLGLDSSNLVKFHNPGSSLEFLAEASSLKALKALIDDASLHGFDLCVASAYRSFDRQFAIVNDKFIGKRAVLDENEQLLDISVLSDEKKVLAILRFSAVPGFSRHHFGTDFDIYAKNCLKDGDKLLLTANEYEKGSYFYEFGLYLEKSLEKFGFSRPFSKRDLFGYEPWHISYEKSAMKVIQSFDINAAIAYLESFDEPWVKYAVEYVKEHKDRIFGEIYGR